MRIGRFDERTVEAVELLPEHLSIRIIKVFGIVGENKVLLNMRFSDKGKVKFTGLLIGDNVYEYDNKTLEEHKELKMYIELMRFSVKQYLEEEVNSVRKYEHAFTLWNAFKRKSRRL